MRWMYEGGAMKVREDLTSISVVRYETYEYAL
jgi:hypothetical protein